MNESGFVLHMGGGFFIPARPGDFPTKNIANAMVFESPEGAKAWAVEAGYWRAGECRMLPENSQIKES